MSTTIESDCYRRKADDNDDCVAAESTAFRPWGHDFGVDQAINLDGGGSTTLAFADGPGGSVRTVNSPSDVFPRRVTLRPSTMIVATVLGILTDHHDKRCLNPEKGIL